METTGPSSDVKGGREIQSGDKGQENIKSYAGARQGAGSPGEGAGQAGGCCGALQESELLAASR